MDYIDPVIVSPDHYKTLLENDSVRVVEMNLGAGQQDELHSHPAETVYFISGSKVRIRLTDGNVVEAEVPDGHVMWNEAWTHQVENVGNTPVRAIIVEDKTTPPASEAAG